MKTKLIAAAGLFLLALPAQAQSPAEVLRSVGFVGTWAANCSEPPTPSTAHTRHVFQGDNASIQRVFSNTSDDQPVLRARVLDDGMVEVVTRGDNYVWRAVYKRYPDGRRQVWTAGKDGSQNFAVLEGKLTSNYNSTPLQTRCTD